ncbi:MAG: glutaredoxin domain-containing protein [Tahibacter sp.]
MRPLFHKATLALALVLFACLSVAANAAPPQKAARAHAAKAEVVMYVMPNCGYCAKAREHLTAIGVQWKEMDIAASQDAHATFSKNGGQGTPLILIGEDRIAGYDVAKLDTVLAKHGLIKR